MASSDDLASSDAFYTFLDKKIKEGNAEGLKSFEKLLTQHKAVSDLEAHFAHVKGEIDALRAIVALNGKSKLKIMSYVSDLPNPTASVPVEIEISDESEKFITKLNLDVSSKEKITVEDVPTYTVPNTVKVTIQDSNNTFTDKRKVLFNGEEEYTATFDYKNDKKLTLHLRFSVIRNIIDEIELLRDKTSRTIPESTVGDDELWKDHAAKLTNRDKESIADNLLATRIMHEANPGLAVHDLEIVPSSKSPNAVLGGRADRAPEGSFYSRKLDEINIIEDEPNKTEQRKMLDDIVDEVETHPIYNPQFEKVSMTDRIVFIAMTFILRGLTLFLIDWGLNSHAINTFNKAFIMYIVIYLCIFGVWVLLVNAGEDGKNMFFGMMFYYVNSNVHGPGRILIHFLVQLMLVPVPFVVKDRMVIDEAAWTYEQRRATYRVLSNFTFFIWLLTSIIALRY